MTAMLSRRAFMAASSALPLAACAAGRDAPTAAIATPPMSRSSYRVGTIVVTPLLDGTLDIPLSVMPAADNAEGEALLTAADMPPKGPVTIPVNAFAVERDGRLWLIDSGGGAGMAATAGRMPAALAALGYQPSQVEGIVLTHLHPDHTGGLLGPQGAKLFPQAEILVQTVEVAFWTDEGARSQAPADMALLFDSARTVLETYKDQVRPVSGSAEVFPGGNYVLLPGHTPGHAGVLFEDSGERLLIWGDIIHATPLQFVHPDWTLTFDTDQAQARATRARVLDMAVADEMSVAGAHMKAGGKVERRGDGYALVA
ncbi:MBL fold metallo-hydrolase [Marinivivus vitaminiproducens]|uniref:MBL fold metallo-hydrolase n=1 Tax=Marinivivus vitaminiproducens TaxID=3035935 RepID=UPI0027A9B0D3|nr:MBL fold metallo-hydrolase [Geminicoccaceae bacterium SCSIO 64248]